MLRSDLLPRSSDRDAEQKLHDEPEPMRRRRALGGAVALSALLLALALLLRHWVAQHDMIGTHEPVRVVEAAAAPTGGDVVGRGVAAAAEPEASGAVNLVIDDGTQRQTLRVRLRPDLSASSAAWMRAAAAAGCGGQLYRSESFLMQGAIRCATPPAEKVVKGSCPPGAALQQAGRVCPPHDPQCGCHGPVMTRGMVGWAGGGTGPDWFVYIGDAPATHWAHDHTVVGQLEDDASWAALAALRRLPAGTGSGGMTMLSTPCSMSVSFTQ